MIHIITNHHKTGKWLNLQSAYLNAFTEEPYQVYCGITEINPSTMVEEYNLRLTKYKVVDISSLPNYHYVKMNALVKFVDNAEDDDILMFLDPDALPIQPNWNKKIEEYLMSTPIVAISREENIEPLLRDDQRPYPHPCFLATTVGFWKENELSWELDPAQGASCAGVLLKKWLDENGHEWRRLLRTNCFNLHPLNFGVYDDLIYHHGSGNRPVYDSIDIWQRPGLAAKYGVSLDLHFPELLEFNGQLSELVFHHLHRDARFVRRYFCGYE
tara:strand:- start:2573 stop:3385 length:813 start_codon:yes stop_codon:yes gene_type:complete